MKANLTILAIETSLDDTCAAVTRDDRVIANVVASQVEFHEEYGGTVPHIARQKHREMITPVVNEALTRAKATIDEVDAIAVTRGPGLAPSLEVGIAKAKELARKWNKPILGVNHLEGHLLSSFAKNSKGKGPLVENKPKFPLLGFLISGGHTELVLMNDWGDYCLLGQTLDDAAGEAYDKVARMLNLGYPGGPILSKLAQEGEAVYDFPEPMIHRKDLNVSFSGLKTAARYKLEKLNPKLTKKFCADFAASFQNAVFKMLMRRFERAIVEYKANGVLLGGGVVANVALRTETRKVARKHKLPVFVPYSIKLYTDNAAMIGVCAYYMAKRGEWWKESEILDRKPNLNFPVK